MHHKFSTLLLVVAGITNAHAAVDSGLLGLLPPDSKVVGGIQVAEGRGSAFGQYLLSKAQADSPQFQTFIDQTQFDPRRDLEEVLFATRDTNSHQPVIIARGTFDRERLTQAAVAKNWVTSTSSGLTVVTAPNDRGNHPMSFAFIDSTLAVMADSNVLPAILAGRKSPTTLEPALQQKITSASNGNQAWFVSLVAPSHLPENAKLPNGQSAPVQALKAIEQASGGIKFADTVQFSLKAETRSEKDATALTDVFRGFSGILQLQKDNNSTDQRLGIIANALSNMKLETSSSTASVNISLSEKDLETLTATKPRQGRLRAAATK